MPALPTIEHIERADELTSCVYVVSPSIAVSRPMLALFAENNPRSCKWVNEGKSLCMSFPAFMIFTYGPAIGLERYRDKMAGVDKENDKIVSKVISGQHVVAFARSLNHDPTGE